MRFIQVTKGIPHTHYVIFRNGHKERSGSVCRALDRGSKGKKRSNGQHKNRNLKHKNRLTGTRPDLSIILNQSGRHMKLSCLVTLAISSLRNLDIEASTFFDIAHRLYYAAILTRCYTQHALRPYIDLVIDHIRHFIKVQFVNKGSEFINLSCIFKDKSDTFFYTDLF